jgi:hypothetical protein
VLLAMEPSSFTPRLVYDRHADTARRRELEGPWMVLELPGQWQDGTTSIASTLRSTIAASRLGFLFEPARAASRLGDRPGIYRSIAEWIPQVVWARSCSASSIITIRASWLSVLEREGLRCCLFVSALLPHDLQEPRELLNDITRGKIKERIADRDRSRPIISISPVRGLPRTRPVCTQIDEYVSETTQVHRRPARAWLHHGVYANV